MVPTGDAVQWLIKFLTKKTNTFIGWAKQNDNKSFQASFGLSFAEIPKAAGLEAYSNGYSDVIAFIDMQPMAGRMWAAFVAGYHKMSNASVNPAFRVRV